MKKFALLIMTCVVSFCLSSCYDREVISDKGLNYFMPAAENVQYTKEGSIVVLTWTIPEVPDDFVRPISVQIQTVENNIYRDKITLSNEETTYSFEVDPANEYRYIIKLVGTFTEEAQEVGRTPSVTSKGVIVKVE